MSNQSVHKFVADITCDACTNAIRKSLTKTFGDRLANVSADIATKELSITMNHKGPGQAFTTEEVFEALKKTGRDVKILN
ncbi:hypothetical protein NH340_JMT07128 [Sarcoptes scabiei]|nr:hypothetical protein NH340_JMT07128 [Sarcoptes scabiei]